MRVALLVPGGVDRGGERRVIPALLWLIERLAANHDVQVLAMRQEDEPATWALAGAQVHNIGRSRTRLRAWQTLARLHRQAPFDIAHAFWAGNTGALAVLAGRRWRIPSLIHVAGGELTALRDIHYGGARTWWGRQRTALQLRSATAVSTASTPMVAALARIGVAAERIPLGVDLRAWPARQPRPHQPGTNARLLHVASLSGVKDQVTLLRAMQALRQAGTGFELDIVGEDTLAGRMQQLARELELDACVRFHGFLTQRQLRTLFDAADLLVMSSRHESGPLVLLEAAVAGIPAVGTAVGHFVEWSGGRSAESPVERHPDAAALAVPVGDAAALASAIRRVLENEPLRLRLAREAQRRALEQDADDTARRVQQLYERLRRDRSD